MGAGHRSALAFLVLGCVSCKESADDSAQRGADAAVAQTSDARDAAHPATPSPERDAGASFADCEPELIPPFGADSAFACERCAPHGFCMSPQPDQGECLCSRRYTGARCELCADGYVELDGACVTPCEAAGMPCPGLCTGTATAPACECFIGYEGAQCDRCSAGFEPDPRVFDGLACVPTCDGACGSEEVCTAPAREEQHCECMAGYARNAGGECVWRGFTADPDFEHGCADWQLFRRVANSSDVVIAELAPSQLTLSVDRHCSAAGATAVAWLPTRHTLPAAAIAITARGEAGANLHVSFDVRAGSSPFVASGDPLAGTGEWTRHVVCLPLADIGRETAITFAVGEPGTCADPLDAAFTVRSLETVADDKCP